jgi:hypothetical protein
MPRHYSSSADTEAMRNRESIKAEKSAAASALTQVKDKPKRKKKESARAGAARPPGRGGPGG